jgi:hypothetical protein
MATFLDILKYILPSLVVLATMIYLVKSYLKLEENKKELQVKLETLNATLPVRMQAYERLVLLLERLQPAGLLLRINQPGMNATSMHTALLQAIRDEFDHNLSQQLYVSSQAWDLVKKSREESNQLINTAASQVSPDATSAELAQQILVRDIDSLNSTTDQAIEFLKKEARVNFF